jgi:hypothetical protein
MIYFCKFQMILTLVDFMNSSKGQTSEHIKMKIKPKVRITLEIC